MAGVPDKRSGALDLRNTYSAGMLIVLLGLQLERTGGCGL